MRPGLPFSKISMSKHSNSGASGPSAIMFRAAAKMRSACSKLWGSFRSDGRAVDGCRTSRREATVATQRRAARANRHQGDLADPSGSGHANREPHAATQEVLVRPQTGRPTRGPPQALPGAAGTGAAGRDSCTARGANRDQGDTSAATRGGAAYAHDREGPKGQALRGQAGSRLCRAHDRRTARARAGTRLRRCG